MSVLKIKDESGNFIPIQTIKGDKGENGKDGVIQYTAGENVTIENNVISAAGNVNDVKVDGTSVVTNKVANIDLSGTGASISLSIDPLTFIMTLELKNSAGTVLSTGTVDLPLETMVVGASYNNGTLTLTLKNGETLDVDISSIISGLVPNTRTIAGIDLQDNVTTDELRTSLNVPTKTSDLTNDNNYISETSVNNSLNAIKHEDVVTNGNAVKCGYKVDGKDVYVKRINAGALPNASTKSIDSGVPLNTIVLSMNSFVRNTSNNLTRMLPILFHDESANDLQVFINLNGSINGNRKIEIITKMDYSTAYQDCYIDICYINN